MKRTKLFLLFVLILLYGCSSSKESFDDIVEIEKEAFSRVLIIPILVSTYQFNNNIFPKDMSQVDSFISSEDFPCNEKINYKPFFFDSLYSNVDFLDSNDTLQNIKINLRPFTIDSFNVFGGDADIILHKVKKDSTFDFEIKTLTVRYTEDQSIKANMGGKLKTSIIKCN